MKNQSTNWLQKPTYSPSPAVSSILKKSSRFTKKFGAMKKNWIQSAQILQKIRPTACLLRKEMKNWLSSINLLRRLSSTYTTQKSQISNPHSPSTQTLLPKNLTRFSPIAKKAVLKATTKLICSKLSPNLKLTSSRTRSKASAQKPVIWWMLSNSTWLNLLAGRQTIAWLKAFCKCDPLSMKTYKRKDK